MIFRRSHLPLLIAPVFLSFLDCALTMYGQSEEYWNGNWNAVDEMLILARSLISIHPVVWFVAHALWVVLFSVFILVMPRTPAIFVSLLVSIGHGFGANSWAYCNCPYSYQAQGIITVVSAVLITISLRATASKETEAAKAEPPLWLVRLRWLLFVAFLIILSFVAMNFLERDSFYDDRLPEPTDIARMDLEADYWEMFDPEDKSRISIASYFTIPQTQWKPVLESLQPYERLSGPVSGFTPGRLRITFPSSNQLYVMFCIGDDDRVVFRLFPSNTWYIGGDRRKLHKVLTKAYEEITEKSERDDAPRNP